MEYSDYIESRDPAEALTGAEKFAFSQSGAAVRDDLNALAAFANTLIDRYSFPFPQFDTATSTTSYTGTPNPAITAYATGQKFQVKVHATSTGASTLNLNGLGAKKVYTNPTTQATTGNLLINQVYILVYDEALDAAAGGFLMVGSGSSSSTGTGEYWRTVPGTPTRVGDTSFTITDTANANLYNLLLGRKTVLRWTDTTDHMAMVVSATYSSNTVTVTIFGDVLSGTATMSSMKYAIQKAEIITFAVAGNVAQANDISRKFFINCETKIFGGKANHGTAGTTNATTYDINKNGTTMFTTKLSVASAATVGSDTTADDDMSASNNDVITVDCDSNSTIYAIDAYVDLYVFPKRNLQLT